MARGELRCVIDYGSLAKVTPICLPRPSLAVENRPRKAVAPSHDTFPASRWGEPAAAAETADRHAEADQDSESGRHRQRRGGLAPGIGDGLVGSILHTAPDGGGGVPEHSHDFGIGFVDAAIGLADF